MKTPKSILILVGALAVLAVTIAACAPATPTPAPTVPPPPAATVAPPTAPPVPTATPGPKRGGKVTMAVWQEPVTLNWLLGTQTVMNETNIFVVEGLRKVDPKGNYVPELAKEIPTEQNGGVSADGKTINWRLKSGIVWSDGKPFTCEDVQWTVQVIKTKGVGIIPFAGYDLIEAVECPDPLTAVVRYKEFYAPYLSHFGAILPKHYTGDPKDIKNWEYGTKPLGTGPFKVQEFVRASHVTLVRNERYREKDKPYLDQVIIRIVPSSEVAMQLLKTGEVDIMWNNTEADLPELEKMKEVKISRPLQIGGERMFFNLSKNQDPADPKIPHPILGDLRVRQAIAYGINKQRIIDKLLYGEARPGTSELNAGYFNCEDIKPYLYDPEKAKKLLDDAGWKPGPDGIRVKEGLRLSLKYQTTSGNKLREESQVLILEDMKAIGVEFIIENAPSATVIGTWDGKSPRARGNFDIIMYTSAAAVDPHSQMVNMFASWMIPGPDNKGGRNYSRFSSPEVDDLLKQAESTPDLAKRKEAYCKIAQIGYDQVNMLYLYQRLDLDSYRDWLQGWVENAWANNGWNAAEWWLSK